MNKITIVGRARPDELPQASIHLTIQMQISEDAPPTLVQAVGRSLGEVLTAWGTNAELSKMAQEVHEIAERHQRQADHAAETLLSRPAAPRESSRTRRKKNPLADEIALHQCYRCDTVYGRRDVAGCAECRPIRVLIGSEVIGSEERE